MARVTNFGDLQAITDRTFDRKTPKANIATTMKEFKDEYDILVGEVKRVLKEEQDGSSDVKIRSLLGKMIIDVSVLSANLNIYLGDSINDQVQSMLIESPERFGKVAKGKNGEIIYEFDKIYSKKLKKTTKKKTK